MKSKIDPANWFLNQKEDVRSSYALEEVATEFDIQGLELDWVGVCWDGDFSYQTDQWRSEAFRGARWQRISDETKKLYLQNAYRVLLTRARQGMVLVVPRGDHRDTTRLPERYDGTFSFLKSCGFPTLHA